MVSDPLLQFRDIFWCRLERQLCGGIRCRLSDWTLTVTVWLLPGGQGGGVAGGAVVGGREVLADVPEVLAGLEAEEQ